MATVTPGIVWTSGETVTPAKLNSAAAPTVVVADGEVTVAKLAAAVQQLLVPAGAVQAFAMNSAPTGWLEADGAAVSRSTYATLFSAIGTTYGSGDGSTTFALPDLRGYFVRGSGTNGDGTAAGTFGEKQADEFKSHTHTVADTGFAAQGAAGAERNIVFGPVTRTTSAAGGAETRPKNIAMLYCIKF
jgi:microcystin-dependent protein